jgi:hypothetical protein
MKKYMFLVIFALMCTVQLNANETNLIKGKVLQHIKTQAYSYLELKSNNKTFWAAVPLSDIKVNEIVHLKEQVWMNDFQSKSLNKVFDKILFASHSSNPYSKHDTQTNQAFSSLASVVKNEEVKFDKNQKALLLTVLELKAKKKSFNHKKIALKGEVVKVLRGIMKTSWVHIKDANGDKMIFRAPFEDVNKGEQVLATGFVNIDVDYGYGYTYEIIMTDSVFKKIN